LLLTTLCTHLFHATIAGKRVGAQGMVGIASGLTQAKEGQPKMSSGASEHAQGNLIELAEGSLGQRMTWNIDKGQMEVMVGGEWSNVNGKQVYGNKAGTGTYEEYVAEDQEMKNKLFERFKAENVNSDGMVTKAQSYEDWEKSQGGGQPLSREEWTEQNQGNLGVVSTTAYANLKFAEQEDKTFGKDMKTYDDALTKESLRKGSLKWSDVELNQKDEFFAKIEDYTDLQFRDYFFGGGTFERSSTRMLNKAPAYLFLKEEDRVAGNLDDEGNFKEGFGPGNKNWEGRVLSLRGQSFVSGSYYRKITAEQQWDRLGEKYKRNRKIITDRELEEKNKNPNNPNNPNTLKYGGFGYTSRTNGDPDGGLEGFGNVSYGDKVARRNSLLNFETVRGEHYQYRFEMDDETKEKVWKAYDKKDASFVRNMRDGAEVAGIEGLQGTQDSSASVFNIKKAAAAKKEKEDKVADVTGGAYVGLINADGISRSNAAAALNNHFPDMADRYEFRERGNVLSKVPSRSGKTTTIKTTQWSKENEVWLYDLDTGKAVLKDGKAVSVKIGSSADKSQFNYINELLADYITDPLNNNN